MNHNRILPAAVAILLLPLSAFVPPANATGPAALECGATITTDTTLTHDLLDCPQAGLVIGADDVTLDLNGHRIDGSEGEHDGVVIADRSGVVVKNGSITDFRIAVLAARAAVIRVTDLQVATWGGGIIVADSEDVVIHGNATTRAVDEGIGVFRSTGVRIVKNFTSWNAAGIVVNESPGVLVDSNLVVRNAFVGLIVESNRAVVRRNTIRRTGNGVIVFANRVRLTRNVVVGAVGCHSTPDVCLRPPPGPCPTCEEGYGISIEGGVGTIVRGNDVLRTRRAGIRVASFDTILPVRDATVRRNSVWGASTDGILVSVAGDAALGRVLLEDNRSTEAGDDGIDVRSPLTTVVANVAVRNTDHGITAVRAAKDGGGNRARYNGHRPQCLNIRCAR